MLLRLLKFVAPLIVSQDGALSMSKLCYVVFVVVFTTKMARTLPDDPLLWLTYGGLVGGVQVAQKLIATRWGPALPPQEQAP